MPGDVSKTIQIMSPRYQAVFRAYDSTSIAVILQYWTVVLDLPNAGELI
jgi:hypothetical protein